MHPIYPNTLNEVSDITAGLSLGKIECYQPKSKSGVIRIIRPQDLSQTPVLEASLFESLDAIVETHDIEYRLQNHHFIQVNDILITARGTIYHAAIVKSLPENSNVILLNNMICVRPNIEYPEAIMLYLNSSWFKQSVLEKHFPKMLTLTVKWLRAQPFTLPRLEKRKLLANLLYDHINYVEALKIMANASQELVEGHLLDAMKQSRKEEL